MKTRYWKILLLAALAGCAHTGTKVEIEEGESFAYYHRIGIPAFSDAQGKGGQVADSLAKAFQLELNNKKIDRAALEQVLLQYKVGEDNDLGVEVLEQVRTRTSIDAIVFGRLAPDWSGVRILMVDAKMGVTVLRAVVKPSRKKKVFSSPDDVAQEIVRALSRAR